GDVSQLLGAGRIELAGPAVEELPGVLVAVELTGRTAEQGPVLLTSQRHRQAVLELVIRFDQEDWSELLPFELAAHLRVDRLVGVHGIEAAQRPPVAIVERRADGVVELDRL